MSVIDPMIMKITGHTSEEMVDHYTDFTEEIVASLAACIPAMLPSGTRGFIDSESKKEAIPEWAVEKLKEANENNWKAVLQDVLKPVL